VFLDELLVLQEKPADPSPPPSRPLSSGGGGGGGGGLAHARTVPSEFFGAHVPGADWRDAVREEIWSGMEDKGLARAPKPLRGRTPNFHGADMGESERGVAFSIMKSVKSFSF
jgi:hypothetical protein